MTILQKKKKKVFEKIRKHCAVAREANDLRVVNCEKKINTYAILSGQTL